ncbi:MAG: 30S ribosomal protein S2 [Micrococcaceae bacterium]
MAVVTTRELLDSGVHFGHQTRRWNPKMKDFIFTERNGIHIIDLRKSLEYIDEAYSFIKNTAAQGGKVLFVGTKRQAQEPIQEQATRVGMPYVNHRWLGGMLTNFDTISKRIDRLKELEEIDFDDVAGSRYTKKELLLLSREKQKLETVLGGIRDMGKAPAALWVVDTNKEHLAIVEAKRLNIPVVAILDTNCDPDEVQFPIPGNDDAIRSIQLLTKIIADAVAEGTIARHEKATGGKGKAAEPMAEWERELLEADSKTDAATTDSTPTTDATASTTDEATSVDTETSASDTTSSSSDEEDAELAEKAENIKSDAREATEDEAVNAESTNLDSDTVAVPAEDAATTDTEDVATTDSEEPATEDTTSDNAEDQEDN